MGDDGLNLNAGQLQDAVKTAAREFHALNDAVLPGLAVAAFLLAVALTILCTRKRASTPIPASLLISRWPAGLRASIIPLLVGYAGTHALSAYSVFYNTRVANPSLEAYWETMGVGRLASLSHAHLFAHATMYFVLAALVQFTSAGQLAKRYAPVAALWAGVFDVVGWWGLKKISPSFEILSVVCGTLFSISFLIMGYAILREQFRREEP